ncbi:MAG: hypothetical protein GY869_07600, partial [Planctomycetes bacterium]|nr:hypothetical protein [Planctomycetota bacterium]
VANEYNDPNNITAVLDANGHRTEQAFNNRNLLETTPHQDQTTETIDCHILNFTRLAGGSCICNTLTNNNAVKFKMCQSIEPTTASATFSPTRTKKTI